MSETGERSNLRVVLETVSLYRRFIIVFVVVGVAIAACYAMLVAPIYSVSIVLIPLEGEQAPSGALSQVLAGSGLLEGSGGGYSRYFVRLLESRTIAERIAVTPVAGSGATPGDRSLYEFFDLIRIPDAFRGQALADKLRKDVVKIRTDLGTGALIMRVSTKDALISAEIANRLSVELDAIVRTLRVDAARRQTEFIVLRLSEVEGQLAAAEGELVNFETSNRLVYASPELRRDKLRLERNVAIQASVFEELKRQQELAKIQEIRNSPRVFAVDAAQPPFERSFPRRGQIVTLAALGSLGAAMLTLLFWQLVNAALKN